MSAGLFKIVAAMFFLKLAFNIWVPYALFLDKAKSRPARSISLMPFVEAGLLGIGIILSLIAGFEWPWNPAGVAVFGVAAIVASYAQVYVVMAMAWPFWKIRQGLVARANKKQGAN